MIFAIDPGTKESAIVAWTGKQIVQALIVSNTEVLKYLKACGNKKDSLHIEMIASYGMPVGAEVFETCVWIGRFIEAWHATTGLDAWLTTRHTIKIHHCKTNRAKDANVRQALIDKYGPPGTKAIPGVTYSLKSHLWAAFALATYVTENRR